MRPGEKAIEEARSIVATYIDFYAPILRSDFGLLPGQIPFEDRHCATVELPTYNIVCCRCNKSMLTVAKIPGYNEDWINLVMVAEGWTRILNGWSCVNCNQHDVWSSHWKDGWDFGNGFGGFGPFV